MKIHYATISETGKRRNNEDAFRIVSSEDGNHWLAVVCDGMGGHAMGEVASETVADAIVDYWKKHADEPDSETKVNNACAHAMRALDKKSDSLNHCQMGTTMVMASIEGDTVTIVHVGDSRCYLQRPDDGLLYQTKDHVRLDYGWEVIDRCFFSYHHEADVPDIVQFKLKAGDRILLCSDGLYKSMAPDILLARMMDEKPLADILDIYDFMCEKQGDDNYTAVLIEVKELYRTDSMKWFGIIAMILLMTMTGCKKGMGTLYRGCFENDDAVSLKDIIKIYDKYASAKEDSTDFDLFAAFYGQDAADNVLEYEIVSDTAFALQLPEYAISNHPFLSNAEVFYNSCLLAFNVWSNHELWLRGCDGFELAEEKDVVDGIKAISEVCIRDKELRQAAKTYKDSIVIMMKRTPEEWGEEEHSMDLLITFGNKIEAKSYKYFTDEKKFVDSLNAMTKELADATKPTLELYRKVEADKRVEMMLHSLNDCSTFDEQCSLFLNWADSPEAELENEWIVAVAEKLMNSGKYNPCLNNIWIIWRCLYQYCYGGISRDSSIPNSIYNDMRKKCYLTCLKRIEKNPNDVFAMNCAAAVGGRVNINRFGQNMFGNEAVIEKHTYLSGRDDKEDKESEEAED